MVKPPDDPRTLHYLNERIIPRNQDCHSDKTAFSVVGKTYPKPDAYEKVTGKARYTADLKRPRCLVGKLLRSTHAHARLVRVDVSKALQIPGVFACVSGSDFGELIGIIPWTKDEPVLAKDVVRYIGEPIAAVAATSESVAQQALACIDVHYEPFTAHFSPEQAMVPDAVLIHSQAPGNASKSVDWEFGEVDSAFARSQVEVSGNFHFEATTHAALETHAVLAEMGADGRLCVWSSTQTPYYLHRELATVLGMPAHQIRVIRPHIGGGFGGKSEPFGHEICAAYLAKQTGRPVKFVFSREETFLTHRGRHAMDMDLRIGYLPDEGLVMDYQALLDGGAYSSYGMITTYYAGTLNAGLYRVPHYRWKSQRVFTNKPPAGPKRGHGTVQPRFAIECLVDQLCEKLGRDPIAFRRELALGPNTETVNGLRIGSSGFVTCLEKSADQSGWYQKFRKMPFGHGIGIAGSWYLSGTNYPINPESNPQSNVQIKADRSGLITLFCGAADIGQGSDAMLRHLLAEELGVDPNRCKVESQDSDICPVDLGSYSSRVTLMAGNAAISAARHLKNQILQVIAQDWHSSTKQLMIADDRVFHLDRPEQSMSFVTALNRAESVLGALGSTGSYNSPNRGGLYRGALVGPSPAYSFTVHIAELEVDLNSGQIKMKRIVAAHDCGRAIHPQLVEGQIEGSVYMGMGEALLERYETAKGLISQPNLLEYKMPTILDVGTIESIIVESPDPDGPYGAKEAGEGPLHAAIPAIANAIYDAIGLRLYQTPFEPGQILKALESGHCYKPGLPRELS